MVHRREVDGRPVAFGNQGALYQNAMTWFDHDTGTIWHQPTGQAIIGERAGQRLELLPSTLSTWGAWQESHPDTWALDADAPTAGFRLADMTIAVEFGEVAKAYPVTLLRETGVVNDQVDHLEIAIVIDPRDDQRWAVFSRRLDDRTVTLEIREGLLRDVGTGTVFDPVNGRALDGPLVGQNLDVLPGFTSFESDFRAIFSDGEVWTG